MSVDPDDQRSMCSGLSKSISSDSRTVGERNDKRSSNSILTVIAFLRARKQVRGYRLIASFTGSCSPEYKTLPPPEQSMRTLHTISKSTSSLTASADRAASQSPRNAAASS